MMEENYMATAQDGSSNVPTFLLKLVGMLDDQSNHEYVNWSPAGTSFIVKDQVRFSKTVLPKYFKHNKFASFVRQLNMYGFRKITSLTQSGLNSEEEVEFYHYLFIRGEDQLLEKIKRKVNKQDGASRNSEDVTKVLADVKQMKNYQENITTRLSELKQENEDLWREVHDLRKKHVHQQKVVNKLIQFLVNLVHQTGMGMKRKQPLMIEDGYSESVNYPPAPKYSKQAYLNDEPAPLALEQSGPTVSFPPTENQLQKNQTSGSGPYITEVSSSAMNPQANEVVEVYPNDGAFKFDEIRDTPKDIASDHQQGSEVTSGTVNFPDQDIGHLLQNPSFQNPNGQNQPTISPHQNYPIQVPQMPIATVPPVISPGEIAHYSPPRSPKLSPNDLNSHVDLMQNNIENIQDLLFSNDQMQLDYGLIQELFSNSPDIMPPANTAPENSGTSVVGNEVVPRRSDSKKIVERDLSDLANML